MEIQHSMHDGCLVLSFAGSIDLFSQLALPDTSVVERAVLVANELVTNAVVHARTELRLRLELRGDWLHLAVRDNNPRLLRLVAVPDPRPRAGAAYGWSSSWPAPGGVQRQPDGSSSRLWPQVSATRSWAPATHGRRAGWAGVARALRGLTDAAPVPGDLPAVLQQLVDTAKTVLAADGVGLMLADADGHLRSTVSTDAAAELLAQVQADFGEGPCLTAYGSGEPVAVTDLGWAPTPAGSGWRR